ncbi:hypothetical protein MASR1M12_00440 [Erysipelotrichia bacterium]
MRVTIQVDSNVYRVAGAAENVDGIGCFEERLLNSISLVRTFSRAGYTPITLPINIRNNDWFIPRELDLWGAVVTVEAMGETWSGQITGYEYDMAGVLYITATEKTAPELSEMVPDEIIEFAPTMHSSAMYVTIPLVVGGTVDTPILVKGILYDKVNGIYVLCVGEIRQVVKVYNGKDQQLTEGFVAYTGAPDHPVYPGWCFVQITDPEKWKNSDGSYAEITADVVGLKLGSHTVEECRNGARFLLWFLKTALSGNAAWGLGISESDIDLDSFADSIAKVDAAGLKMDGILYFRQKAQSWIDQICNAIRGRYRINKNGKRTLFVDAPASSVKTYSPALSNIKLLQYGKGAYVGRVYNKGRLEHSYNPITGQFMQSDTYENATSIAKIDEQKFIGQSYLLRDPASAKAILDYTCKKSETAAWKVLFETLELPDDAADGQVITVDHPAHAITGLFQIVRIQITDFAHTIEAERYSVNDFVSGTPGATIAWTKDAPISPADNPGQASGLTLASEVRPSPDGSNIVVLTGRFTPPTGGYLAASVEYAQGILPILDWTDFGLLRGSSFEIAPVEPGQPYAVRIRMMSPTGKSDFITGTITVQGDDIPPGIPTITVSSYLKTVTIKCVLSPYPSDMAGFEIFRHTSNNSAAAQSIGKVAGAEGVATIQDTETAYGMTYYYFAKAYDTWGNPSGFSTSKSTFITFVQTSDLADQILSESRLFAQGVVDAAALSNAALKQAGGAVAAWSAKGCTTASIAEAGGVVDTTGNGNNGQAFGGVTVIDNEVGKAFSFDGNNGYISAPTTTFSGQITIALNFRYLNAAFARGIAGVYELSGTRKGICIYAMSATALRVYYGNGTSAQSYVDFTVPSIIAAWRSLVVTANALSQTVSLFYDGILIGTQSTVNMVLANVNATFGRGVFDYSGDYANVLIAFPRIYSRELSLSESKSYHMFSDDAVFARITADFIGAYELVSRHHASDSVVARIIAAGAVTMEKLLIGAPGAALNDDPGFMDHSAWETMDGYASSAGWTLASITDGKVGSGVMRGNGTASPTANAFIQKRYTPIDLSKTYRLHALGRKRDASTNGTIYLSVRCYNNAKSVLSPNAGTYLISAVAPGTTWTEYNATIGPKGQFQFPAGTAFVRIGGLLDYYTTAGAGYELQDFRLEECTPSTLIQNGAILGQHLTVEEAVITVGAQIANLVVGNAHISDMHGSKITAGTLAITGLESSAQNTINTAYSNAGTALTNAATAQTTANNAASAASNAQSSANTANSLLADIAADNKLTPLEKQDARQEWDIIAAEKAGINSQATTFGITTENTTYNNAFQALANYLNAGTTWSSGIPSWIADANLGTTTTIVGATFRTNWKTYYDARTALLNAISAKAKTLADAAQTTANTANSAATTALLASSVKQLSATQKLFLNVLGYQYNVSSTAGYLIIRTPITASFMCKIRITGYNYAGSTSNLDLTLSFYAYTNGATFTNYSYTSIGNFTPSKIQLCRDANNCVVILIGLSTTAWSYPSVAVPEALISYQLPPDSYKDGWTASIATNLTGLTGLVNVSGLDMQKKTVENAATLATWCWNNNLTYIDGATIYTGTVGTVQLTAEQIYGKDIRSGQNVGESNGAGGYVPGTRMKPTGFEAFNVSGRTFFADNNGNAGIGGFALTPTGMTAGSGSTAIGMSIDPAKKAFWAGNEKFHVAHDGTGKLGNFNFTSSGLESANTVGGVVYTTLLINSASQSSNGLVNRREVSANNFGFVQISSGGIYAQTTTAAGSDSIQLNGTNLLAVFRTATNLAGFTTNGIIYASGYQPYSDESIKSDIAPVNALGGLKKLRVRSYRIDDQKLAMREYQKQMLENLKEKNACAANSKLFGEMVEDYNPQWRIGVMAAEFNAIFGTNQGNTERYDITDAIGVSLRAIQELAEIVDDQAAEIAELRAALKLPEKQKKQANSIEFTAEDIEKAADDHVRAAYEAIVQEAKKCSLKEATPEN